MSRLARIVAIGGLGAVVLTIGLLVTSLIVMSKGGF